MGPKNGTSFGIDKISREQQVIIALQNSYVFYSSILQVMSY